jgi:SWI/SNF-related matrix-associated actin-dependent regulator of chromatin subfamily A member 5
MTKSTTLGHTLQRMAWRTVILDEGHRIKNLESDTARACCHMRACFKLILTGTPVQNNLHETFCLLHFLAPKIFDHSERFDSCFQLKSSNVTVDRSALNEAHYMMRPFILRRVKTEVEQKLPPKLETMILCPLSDMQRFWTKRILLKDSKLLERIEETYAQQSGNGKKVVASGEDWKKLQSMLAQLRKAANHP